MSAIIIVCEKPFYTGDERHPPAGCGLVFIQRIIGLPGAF